MSGAEEDSNASSSSGGNSSDLDFSSSSFKPLRVLYSRKAEPPVPDAKVHDNVGSFEARYKMLGGFGEQYSDERLKQIRAGASTSKKAPLVPKGEAPVRRFLPHQEMIKVERPLRLRKNIFTGVENFEGPLGQLRTWMRERVRVKVYTRKEKGVRGYVTGFVDVFDKHWNMAMTDVFESWRRRKYRYSENKVCMPGKPEDCSERLRQMGIQIPEVSVKSVDRKYVICTRKIGKLLIRGEQVVLVIPEKAVKESTKE